MKRSTIAIAVLAAGLVASPLLVTAQAPSKPPANSMGHDMSAMQEQMKKMQAQMDKIRQTKDAKERQKLMFRIKARIDPELLQKHLQQVKTGLPGMAYVKLDPAAPWPPVLQRGLMQ